MRVLLLVALTTFALPTFAQAALVVDGPTGYVLEVVDGALTEAQQRAVDEGRAALVRRTSSGRWCLGCPPGGESHRLEHRRESETTRRTTEESGGSGRSASYEATMTLEGDIASGDPQLVMIERDPALRDLKISTSGGQTRLHVRLAFGQDDSLREDTAAALDALRARASQSRTESSTRTVSRSHTVTD